MITLTFGLDTVTLDEGVFKSKNKGLADMLQSYGDAFPPVRYNPDQEQQLALIVAARYGGDITGRVPETGEEEDDENQDY